MIQFAEAFPQQEMVATLSRQLSWSHFRALLPPANHGLGCYQDERLFPSCPGSPQQNPEQFLRRGESAARSRCMQCEQLLPKGKVFEDQVLAGTNGTNQPTQQMSEARDAE
jgi:hypothetical protein